MSSSYPASIVACICYKTVTQSGAGLAVRTSSQSRESHDVRVGMLTVGAHVLQLLLGVQALATEPRHLRLVAALERPTDGYCVDIPDGGQYLRIYLPLFAHNCKPALTTDSAVKSTLEGRLERTFSQAPLQIAQKLDLEGVTRRWLHCSCQ